MKVLWLCGVLLPDIAAALGVGEVYGGWLTGLLQDMRHEVSVTVLAVSARVQRPVSKTLEGVDYHVLPASYNEQQAKSAMAAIWEQGQFDAAHLFGSEYAAALWMAQTLAEKGQIDRAVLHMQGLVSEIAGHYGDGIPLFWQRLRLPRDLLRDGSIMAGQRLFAARGENEKKLFSLLRHVSGRTQWDRACAEKLNPHARYHLVHETLRDSFYRHQWRLSACEPHSLFVSQGSYPVKGLHQALKAMPLILRQIPDAKLYVAGDCPFRTGKSRLKENGYGLYIRRLMDRYGLRDRVIFLGPFSEEKMCGRYLQSHVFLSPSSIENSPNSLGEAMLLGMPCASSDVGGVRSMLADHQEGLLYPFFDTRALADSVIRLMEDDALSCALGERARRHALRTHDAARNARDVLAMYRRIATEGQA